MEIAIGIVVFIVSLILIFVFLGISDNIKKIANILEYFYHKEKAKEKKDGVS